MMWSSVALTLYALAACWIMLQTETTDGSMKPVIVLSIGWPIYAVVAIAMYILNGTDPMGDE